MSLLGSVNQTAQVMEWQTQLVEGKIDKNEYMELLESTKPGYIKCPVTDMSASHEEIKEALSLMVKSFADSIHRSWGGDGDDFLNLVISEMRALGYPAENRYYDLDQGIVVPAKGDGRKRWPNALKRLVFERDEYRCVKCGGHLNLSIDHIHPFSKGGSDDESNLQTLCRSCNSSKGASLGS